MFPLFQFLAISVSPVWTFLSGLRFFLFCHRFNIIIRDKGNEVGLFENILNHDNRYLNYSMNYTPQPLLKSLVWLHVLKSLQNERFYF